MFIARKKKGSGSGISIGVVPLVILALVLLASIITNVYMYGTLQEKLEEQAAIREMTFYFAGGNLRSAADHLGEVAAMDEDEDLESELTYADKDLFASYQFVHVMGGDMPQEDFRFLSGLYEAIFRVFYDIEEEGELELAGDLETAARTAAAVLLDASREFAVTDNPQQLYSDVTARLREGLEEENLWSMLVEYGPHLEDGGG